MAWKAVRLGAGAVGLLGVAAACFWATYVLTGAVVGGPPAQPATVTVPSASSHAPPSVSPPPWPHRQAPASLGPVSAVPIRTRPPAWTAEPSPARTTPRATVSATPTPTPTPTPAGTPTASVAPSTAITAPPPPAGSSP